MLYLVGLANNSAGSTVSASVKVEVYVCGGESLTVESAHNIFNSKYSGNLAEGVLVTADLTQLFTITGTAQSF